jgi:hypothetical protein
MEFLLVIASGKEVVLHIAENKFLLRNKLTFLR